MKINLTKKEYRTLIDMLYLADWMANAHVIGGFNNEYAELQKKFFSFFKEMNAEDMIEYSKASDDYFMNQKNEERLQTELISTYNNNSFWEELIDRLATRDVIKQIGIEKYQLLEYEEKVQKLDKYLEFYAREFEKNDLDSLNVVNEKVMI